MSDKVGKACVKAQAKRELVTVGRLSSVVGIKGWHRVKSYCEPADQLFKYSPLWFKTRHGVKACKFVEWDSTSKGFTARVEGIETRNDAEAFGQCDIAVERSSLPQLDDNEFYLRDLEGLKVHNLQEQCLGVVSHVLQTGANDVCVVEACSDSVDDQERLIPFVFDHYIVEVDTAKNFMKVDWPADF